MIFKAFNFNIVCVRVGTSPAGFKESQIENVFKIPLSIFQSNVVHKACIFLGMFGVKLIDKTPAFRTNDKKLHAKTLKFKDLR